MPIGLGQRLDRAVDPPLQLARLGDRGRIGRARGQLARGVDRYGRQTLAADQPVAALDDDPAEPAWEGGRLTQLRQAQ